ncbi:hypothetical protein QOZ80_9AG0682140 [Eleusine coracana subsp. coracana]|nr:hypothetical protein QOZ80_9AG0682140 [Eleusine coracana subsp. coracana]
MEAPGWQQHWRTPAFGEWNYGQYDYSADGYTPLTPCFDVVAVRMTNAIPVRKPTKPTPLCFRRLAAATHSSLSFFLLQQTFSALLSPLPPRRMQRARATGNTMRRQRIPAFGEWNYNSDGNGSWPAASTPFFDLAAAHKPANTERKNDGDNGVAETKRRAAEAHGRRLSKVADSGDYYAARKSCFTVVAKAVDDDLYGVPPDMLFQKQARRGGWLRMLLMAGCFCRGGTCTA